MPHVQSHSLVYIKNIDPRKTLEVKWDGVVQAIMDPGEVLPFTPEIAMHARDTLVSRLLIRSGKKPGNEKLKKSLEDQIVVNGNINERPTVIKRKEAEETAEELAELHAQERSRRSEEAEPTVTAKHTVLKKRPRQQVEEEIDETAEVLEDEVHEDEVLLDETEEAVNSEDKISSKEDVKAEMEKVNEMPTRQQVLDYATKCGINVADKKMFNYLESLSLRHLILEIDYPYEYPPEEDEE